MTILVCTDFSAGAAAGEREAARRFPDAELILFHAVDIRLAEVVADLTSSRREEMVKSMARYADVRLNEVVERLKTPGRRVTPELCEGNPVELALEAAKKHAVELMVLGVAAGVEVGRFRTRLGRRARVPVLIVPTEV